jgi:hypothetical protein
MSNSLLVDLDNDPADIEKLKEELQEAAQDEQDNESEDSPEEAEDSLPEKYRGKSLEDVIEMHRNAESELGRKGNELGQYMSLTDQLLKLKRAEDLEKGGAESISTDNPDINISTDELLDNPKAALQKIVNASLEQYNREQQKKDAERTVQERVSDFQKRHPDAQTITGSEEFKNWVESSATRKVSAAHAAAGDLDSGDALLTEWKALQEERKEARKKDKGKKDALEQARRAKTESRGGGSGSDVPQGKVYRRLDLIRLKLQDPEAYGDPAFQDEIMKAYAEGRVK